MSLAETHLVSIFVLIPGLESFFNISVSYREDADVKTVFYGMLEKVKPLDENLTELIAKFGTNNKQIANKSAKVRVIKVTIRILTRASLTSGRRSPRGLVCISL